MQRSVDQEAMVALMDVLFEALVSAYVPEHATWKSYGTFILQTIIMICENLQN